MLSIHMVLGLEGFQKGDVLIMSISQGLDFVNAANRRIVETPLINRAVYSEA
jgi:hypothetical protein